MTIVPPDSGINLGVVAEVESVVELFLTGDYQRTRPSVEE